MGDIPKRAAVQLPDMEKVLPINPSLLVTHVNNCRLCATAQLQRPRRQATSISSKGDFSIPNLFSEISVITGF